MALRGIVLLVCLALVAAGGFAAAVDRGAIAERVTAQAAAALERPVTAAGAEVALWPRPEVALRDVTIARAPGRARPAMIGARRVVAELAALPLLWGESRIERVRVEAPRLIANLGLGALAALPALAPSPEIIVTGGSGRLAVRIGADTVAVVLDRLEGGARAGEIAVEAEGRAAGSPFMVEGTLAPDGRFHARRLLLGGAELAATLFLEPRYERTRLVADLDVRAIDLADGLARWRDTWRGLAGLAIDAPLSLAALAELDLALEVRAARVSANGAELTDARLSLSLDNGRLEIAQARASHAGGAIALTALADRGARAFALDIAGDVPLAVLGLAAAREDAPGDASIYAALRARGLSPRQILVSLEGGVRATLAGARVPSPELETVDIVLPWLDEAKVIALKRATVDFEAVGGVVTAREVMVETPRVALAIAGAVDFNEMTVHLEITPTVKDESIADQTVPLIVTGPLAAPAVLPNPEAEP